MIGLLSLLAVGDSTPAGAMNIKPGANSSPVVLISNTGGLYGSVLKICHGHVPLLLSVSFDGILGIVFTYEPVVLSSLWICRSWFANGPAGQAAVVEAIAASKHAFAVQWYILTWLMYQCREEYTEMSCYGDLTPLYVVLECS